MKHEPKLTDWLKVLAVGILITIVLLFSGCASSKGISTKGYNTKVGR